jgi:hypothetical protein
MRHALRSAMTLAITLVLAAGLAGCSSLKITHEQDPAADLASYTTFEMIPSKSISDPEVAHVVERMVADELTSKGLSEVDSKGDLLVTCWSGSREQIATGLGYAVETVNGQTTVYTVSRGVAMGTLVINLIDRSNGTVVWRASGEKALRQEGDAAARVDRFANILRQVFASYPTRS